MDELLWAMLTGASEISTVVGGRVFWGLAPQDAPLPYLVLNQISARDHAHMQGAGGFWQYRVQIDSYGADRPAARALSRAVRGVVNGATNGAILLALFDGEREIFEGSADGRPSRFSQDYIVTWRP